MGTTHVRVEFPQSNGEKRIVRDERIIVVGFDGTEIDISSIVLKGDLPIDWQKMRTLNLSIAAVVIEAV